MRTEDRNASPLAFKVLPIVTCGFGDKGRRGPSPCAARWDTELLPQGGMMTSFQILDNAGPALVMAGARCRR